MTSFTLPRYQPRLFVDVTLIDDGGDEAPRMWFALFAGASEFRVGWPATSTVRRVALGPLGLPRVRGG